MINSAWLILGAIILGPIFFAAFSTIIIFRRKRRGRRSPLTGNLLRGPGESLRTDIESITEKLNGALVNLFTTFVPPLIVFLLLAYLQSNKVPIWQLALTYLFFLLLVAWATQRLYRLLKQRSNFYLGLDAELAVGQELNHLMAQGCRVFHDFPAENFNIDHVVIAPSGVYAVETKGRSKPDRKRGQADSRVVFNGKALQFPDKVETDPLDQAKRQADWLSKWLTSAVGTSVKVRGILIFPGWFVERRGTGQINVLSGKEAYQLGKSGSTILDAEMIRRISHQVEQRCRDVEPTGYRKDKKKAA
jgi:Nuclease-related domain